MSKTNIKILLTLLAALIVGGVYLYVYKPNMDKKDSLEGENASLQIRLDDLRAKEQYREQYEKETKEFYEEFDKILADYPANWDQELSVMFMKGIEDNYNQEFLISSVGLGTPTEFYTLGSGDYVCYSAAYPISYTGNYANIKDILEYISNYKYRMNIDSVSISYDTENDVATGSINMNAYYITGADRDKDSITLDVPEGVENIFIGGADAASASNKSYAYDADNGASIATNNDIKITLANANNDAGAGIIVAAGKEEVTSKENKVETVNVKIYKDADKTFATYSIGSDEKTVEITSKDVKIYVASSERVDSDDTNGIKLNITNDTDLNVFIKVDNDDAKSPRFSKGSSNGTVKVY